MGWGDLLIRGAIRESSLVTQQAQKSCQAFVLCRHFVKKFRRNFFHLSIKIS